MPEKLLIERLFNESLREVIKQYKNKKYDTLIKMLSISFNTITEIIDYLDSVGFTKPIPHETKDSYITDLLLLEILSTSKNITPTSYQELSVLFSETYYSHIKTYVLLSTKESENQKENTYNMYLQIKKFTNAMAICYLTRTYPKRYGETLSIPSIKKRILSTLFKSIDK